jgi:hypothetical protein
VAQPTTYDRQFNFANQQALTPATPVPANQLDTEYNAIKITLDEILSNLALIQRDDGELANETVGEDQLKPELALLGGSLADILAAETAAEAAAAAAEVSKTAAQLAETNAETAETNAESSEGSAALSAATATAAKDDAITAKLAAEAAQAGVAADAGAAVAAAAAASVSETNAAASETAAATSETNAATAETAAEAAQAAAESARDDAEAALDSFDDIYLGPKASDPTLDNDGDALAEGQLYWNTTADELRVYDGAAWVAYSAGTGLTPGQLPGTDTNDDASAGNVGEIIESEILAGSAVALTTNTPVDVTSISLTAGDWDVWGNVTTANNGTTITALVAAINTVSATQPTAPGKGARTSVSGISTSGNCAFPAGKMRLSLASTTTVYLIGQSTFTGGTSNSAYGYIGARRVR